MHKIKLIEISYRKISHLLNDIFIKYVLFRKYKNILNAEDFDPFVILNSKKLTISLKKIKYKCKNQIFYSNL